MFKFICFYERKYWNEADLRQIEYFTFYKQKCKKAN